MNDQELLDQVMRTMYSSQASLAMYVKTDFEADESCGVIGFDSLDRVEIGMALEDAFGLPNFFGIPVNRITAEDTPRQIAARLRPHVPHSTGGNHAALATSPNPDCS